jgi:protein phosphatase-4 regulatory subunit 3
MNGHASDSPEPQSLLQASNNFTASVADTTGAGSTSVSDSEAPLQDASTPIDQNLASAILTNVSPRELSVSEPQNVASSAETTGEVVQTAEVLGEGQDKGGIAEVEAAQAEPLAIKQEADVSLEVVNGQIELLEHTPEATVVGTGEAGLIVQEDGQDWIPDPDHELKRVKVRKNPYLSFIPIPLQPNIPCHRGQPF